MFRVRNVCTVLPYRRMLCIYLTRLPWHLLPTPRGHIQRMQAGDLCTPEVFFQLMT